jgi:hypothetical protein
LHAPPFLNVAAFADLFCSTGGRPRQLGADATHAPPSVSHPPFARPPSTGAGALFHDRAFGLTIIPRMTAAKTLELLNP